MLNSSARIGSSVSGGKPADATLRASRIEFFTTTFEIAGPAMIQPEQFRPEKCSSSLSPVSGSSQRCGPRDGFP